MNATDISHQLASRIDALVLDLLPAGHREGHEWRCGSVAGEAGHSLGVHLIGHKRGVWSDFSTDRKGDALELVRQVLGCSMGGAIGWSRSWLALDDGEAAKPSRPVLEKPKRIDPPSAVWRKPWQVARPIMGTVAESYLYARHLGFDDPVGDVLRCAERHPRRNAAGELEQHPALLALLRDIRTGEPTGTINVYLRPDGSDRLRDPKGKTTWGRAAGSAVMLSGFEDVTYGLTICEGTETGIALLMADLAPVWCCGGAGNLSAFPVLAGIEALTVAADADEPGQKAGRSVIDRWHVANRDAVLIAPPQGDWADGRR